MLDSSLIQELDDKMWEYGVNDFLFGAGMRYPANDYYRRGYNDARFNPGFYLP